MIAPARSIVVALLLILPLFPPETRGEALAGSALLIGLLATACWRDQAVQGIGKILLVLVASLALPALSAAFVPAAAIEPLTLAVLAGTVGIAASALRSDEGLGSAAATTIALVGGWVGGHGLFQKLWGLAALAERIRESPSLPDHPALMIRLETGRVFAAFATPAALGGFLAISLPVTVGLALAARGGRRLLWLVALLLQLAGFLAAASATAAAALLASLVLAMVVWGRSRRLLARAVLALVLVLAFVALSRGERLLGTADPDNPWRLRAGNARSAWSMAVDHPWIGVGPGGFAEMYPGYRRQGDNETRHAHNLPLELAAELGWGGAVLVTLFFFYVLMRPLWLERHTRLLWRQGAAIGLSSFALQNLGDFTVYMPSLLWTAAFLAGLLGPWPVRDRTCSGPAISGASLATVWVAVGLAVVSGLASNARYDSRRAAHEGDRSRALELAERGSALAPWDVETALLLARLSLEATREPQADTATRELARLRVERVVRLSPVRASARELRAEERLRSGDAPGAFADLAEAARLYPLEAGPASSRDRLRERLGSSASPDASHR